MKFIFKHYWKTIVGILCAALGMLITATTIPAQAPSSIRPGRLVYIENSSKTVKGDTLVVSTLDEIDIVALDNSLLSITDWIKKAVEGKVNSCRDRMIQRWLPILQEDSTLDAIPSKPDSLIMSIVRREDYLDRAASDLKEK